MRKIGHKCFIGVMVMCLSFSLVWAPVANAQAGIAAGRLSVAISEITIAKAARWGFAANDPRVTATRAGISGGLTILATGAGVVSWPVLLVGAGIGALAIGAIALAKDGKFKWTFGGDKSITSSGTTVGGYAAGDYSHATTTNGGGPILSNTTVYAYYATRKDPTDNHTIYDYIAGSNAEQIGASYAASLWDGASVRSCGRNGPSMICDTTGGQVYLLIYQASDLGITSSTGFYDGRPPLGETPIAPIIYSKPDDAIAAIPADVASQIMSSDLLAAAVNTAWKGATSAAVTGGIPWSASDPVTPAEVSTWMAANPSSVPTVANFGSAATVSVGGQVAVPVGDTYSMGGGSSASLPSTGGSTTTPSTGTGTGTGTSPSTGTTAPTTGSDENSVPLNLGPIPNIAAPTLEDTPDAAKILDPGFSLMPDLKNFSVPAHSGACPTAAFTLYGKNYVMDAHCNLLEQNRSLIGALMVLVFTLAATYTVLRA